MSAASRIVLPWGPSTGGREIRRIVVSGLVGALPGAAIVAASVGLEAIGAITPDQSQAGFIGIPIMALGLLIGIGVGVWRGRAATD